MLPVAASPGYCKLCGSADELMIRPKICITKLRNILPIFRSFDVYEIVYGSFFFLARYTYPLRISAASTLIITPGTSIRVR